VLRNPPTAKTPEVIRVPMKKHYLVKV